MRRRGPWDWDETFHRSEIGDCGGRVEWKLRAEKVMAEFWDCAIVRWMWMCVICASDFPRRFRDRYNRGVKPLRRPFADWVDDRVIPAYTYFVEDHPWLSTVVVTALWFGIRSVVFGEWGLFLAAAGVELVAVVYLAIGWDVRRRERRIELKRENHICLHCGYDMRAVPERCSECGKWADEPVDE
jgi:hypothetical protein